MNLCSYNFTEDQLRLHFKENFNKIKIQKSELSNLLDTKADYEVISICFNKMKNNIIINVSIDTNIVGLIIETEQGVFSFLLTRSRIVLRDDGHTYSHGELSDDQHEAKITRLQNIQKYKKIYKNVQVNNYLKNENIYATFRKKEIQNNGNK